MAARATKPTTVDSNDINFIVLRFADSKIPVFKENKNRNYVRYGDDNNYGDYLTTLFNKSAKHNAIVNGKAFYIFGKGYNNGKLIVNRLRESLNDVIRKCVLDLVLFGGFRIEIVYNRRGLIAELYHVDFNSLRTANDGGFYFAETWTQYMHEDDATYLPAFNPDNPYGTQIYAYNEYRPGTKYYPLPDYIGCNNYIETDIEISKYYLSSIRNGMTPSKMVQFFEGEPTEDKKKEIERRFKSKFAGAENAGNVVLVFSKDPNKAVNISDLSATDLDKQFIEMNKTVQQEIFSGHLVTSPMLFGIKTEGQLGGNTELQNAYSLFKNTYAAPKAATVDSEVNYLLGYSIFNGEYALTPTDPITMSIDIDSVIDILPREYVLRSLGIPEDLWNDETIGGNVGKVVTENAEVNDNLKNLTAKQHQQLNRVIRQYKKGQLEEAAARLLLKSSLGLNDFDVNTLLGLPVKLQKDFTEDEIIDMFSAVGDLKEDYEIIKSKAVSFSSVNEARKDEVVYKAEAFKTYDVTLTEGKILDLIKKDAKITPEVIAKTIGQNVAFVNGKIDSLIKRGYIEVNEVKSGIDTVIERTVPKGLDIPNATIKKTPVNKIAIKYSYEGPEDSRNRPFCAKMLKLKRLYSRAQIELISERLGYSVWDRRGGFWRHKNGDITPYCRHTWKSNIVIKKEA